MAVTNFVILITLATGHLCDFFHNSSSYQNQVHGNFEDIAHFNNLFDFFPKSSFYEKENTFESYENPEFNQAKSGSTNLTEDHAWFSYDPSDPYGPEKWGKINKKCDGNSQSPIALYEGAARRIFNNRPLSIEGFFNLPDSVKVTNTGHSVSLTFNFSGGNVIKLSQGPLKSVFNVDNIHFHWGPKTSGSEHVLNGRRLAAEAHIVAYNAKYGSLTQAANAPNGLAVLSILYEHKDSRIRSTNSNPFVKLLSKIVEPETSYLETKDVFSIRDLIKTKDFKYLSYKGSLTTPDCHETVTWMVSTTPIKISTYDLNELRKLKDEKGSLLTTNFRPIQRNNNRKIYLY